MLRRRTVGIPPFPHLTSCRSGKESANQGVFTASVARFLGFCRFVAFAYRSGFVMRPAFTTPEVGPGRCPHRGSTTAALPGNRLSPDLISRSRSRTPQGIAPPVRSESHGKFEPCAVGPNAPRVPFVRVSAEGLSSLKHNPVRFFPLTTGCPSCRIPSNAVSRSSTLSVVAHPLRVFSFPPILVLLFDIAPIRGFLLALWLCRAEQFAEFDPECCCHASDLLCRRSVIRFEQSQNVALVGFHSARQFGLTPSPVVHQSLCVRGQNVRNVLRFHEVNILG